MNPTNEQIIAEAHRRFVEEQRNHDGLTPEGSSLANHIIEVMRENWTPPKPVDPDILAFREWALVRSDDRKFRDRAAVVAGKLDYASEADAFLAGARMATERERERAKGLVEFVEDHSRRLDGVGSRALAALAKYRGEA